MAERNQSAVERGARGRGKKPSGAPLGPPEPGKRRRGRPRGRAKVSPQEALAALQQEVVTEGDLPAREAAVILGRTIYSEWVSGWSTPDLADKHRLSERQVENIVAEYQRARLQVVPGPASALMLVHGHIARLERLVSEYAQLADAPETAKLPSVRLAALKQKAEALRQWLDVVQEMGWLPRQLGTLNVHMDAVQMADTILEEMDRCGVPEATQRRIVEAVEMRVIANTEGRLHVDLSDVPIEGVESEPAA